MRVERVTSADDPRVADFLALTDVALRRRREPAEGLFLAEGEKVIRRALAAGYAPRAVLLAPRWLDPLADVLEATGVVAYVAEEEVLRGVTGFHVHRGALASLDRRPLPGVEEVLGGARRVVVLEDVNDHANVGVVFRAAAGLGVDAVLLGPRCADPLYRRAVKVSMGAVFALPYARLDSWWDAPARLRAAGLTVLALTPDPSAVALPEVRLAVSARWALLLGAEGPGLSERWLAEADLRVRIPMAGGVDSLNVAAAAAVACYALTTAPSRDPL